MRLSPSSPSSSFFFSFLFFSSFFLRRVRFGGGWSLSRANRRSSCWPPSRVCGLPRNGESERKEGGACFCFASSSSLRRESRSVSWARTRPQLHCFSGHRTTHKHHRLLQSMERKKEKLFCLSFSLLYFTFERALFSILYFDSNYSKTANQASSVGWLVGKSRPERRGEFWGTAFPPPN